MFISYLCVMLGSGEERSDESNPLAASVMHLINCWLNAN